MAGTQRLTSGSLSGDGAFDIAAGGALELDVDADSHFAGAISGGDGDFLKLGDNVLELSGANVSRSATVAEGTLHLLGSFTAPRFDVNGGATLSGTGSIDGDLEVTGRLAPGDSPGTITVNGDVTFVSGSMFSVEIDGRAYSPAGGQGSYDRLVVTGADSVVFAGGTIEPQLRGISAANNDFTPIIGDVFRVIETEDNPAGVSGTFDTLVATPNGLTDGTRFSVVYGGDYVDLAVIPDDFGAFAQTYEYDNMTQAAAAFETIFTPQVAASEFLNGLNALSQDRLALALLEASGEIHAFTLSGVKHGSRSLSASALDYLGTTPDGRLIWSDIRGLSVDIEDDEIASMHRADHHQLWLGADFLQTEDMRVGAAFGYAGGTIDAAVSGSSDYDGLNLALYYHRELGAFEFSGIAGVGVVEMTTARSTSLSTGTTSNTSESQANLAFVEGRVSHEQDFGTTLSGTAWSSLRFDVVRGDGFTEAGSALTSLAVGEQTDRSATVSIGYDLVGDFQIGARDAEWRLGVGATRTTQNGRISGRDLSLHGASWRVSSPDADSVSGFISSGVSIDIADNGYLDLSLRADGAEGWGAYGAAVGFGVQW